MQKYYIATDGSKSKKGAGFGIASDLIKIASPVRDYIVKSVVYPYIQYDMDIAQPATNNRGELLAILYALHYIGTCEPARFVIITDSEYSQKIYTTWYDTWIKTNQFANKANKDIISLTIAQIDHLKSLGYRIAIMWQKAHLSNAQISVLDTRKQYIANLNAEADRLANLGATLNSPTQQ